MNCKAFRCKYHTGINSHNQCDYILFEGNPRGCEADSFCEKYVPKRGRKFIDWNLYPLLAAMKLTDKQIAEKLGCSIITVRKYKYKMEKESANDT